MSFETALPLTRTSKLLEIYFSLSPNACLTFHKAYSETPKHTYFTYQPGLRQLHFMTFGWVTDRMWAGLTSVSVLHCAYPFLQLRCFDLLQWHTAYSKFHEYLSDGYNILWGKSRSLVISKINTLYFLWKTAEKQVSCYPAIFTYSLQNTDPTLRDVYREIIAICFQNRMKVTAYGLKANFLNITAGGT